MPNVKQNQRQWNMNSTFHKLLYLEALQVLFRSEPNVLRETLNQPTLDNPQTHQVGRDRKGAPHGSYPPPWWVFSEFNSELDSKKISSDFPPILSPTLLSVAMHSLWQIQYLSSIPWYTTVYHNMERDSQVLELFASPQCFASHYESCVIVSNYVYWENAHNPTLLWSLS